ERREQGRERRLPRAVAAEVAGDDAGADGERRTVQRGDVVAARVAHDDVAHLDGEGLRGWGRRPGGRLLVGGGAAGGPGGHGSHLGVGSVVGPVLGAPPVTGPAGRDRRRTWSTISAVGMSRRSACASAGARTSSKNRVRWSARSCSRAPG